MFKLQFINKTLERSSRAVIQALAISALLVVGGVDYLTGYELSLSVFYLAPVAIASWYAGRASGISMAFLACFSWYIADLATGHTYSNSGIPVWNAFVRFGFFIITALLLSALRTSHRAQLDMARLDTLTGLYGRREFNERLIHDLAMAQRHKSALSLAYVDVDNFKAVNDTYGHDGGDKVLQAIANSLRKSFRKIDTVARLGGDEFALILPDTDSDSARKFFARFEHEFRTAPELSNWGITCSVGVVTILVPVISPEQAIASADELMYKVKRGGKGSVAYSVFGETVQPGVPAGVNSTSS